jgi:hypothetical protein
VADIYAIGVNGRVFTEGSSQGKMFIVEAFSKWNATKYSLVISATELKIILKAENPAIFLPGHKRELIFALVKYLYFDYTLTLYPPFIVPSTDETCEEIKQQKLSHVEDPDPSIFPSISEAMSMYHDLRSEDIIVENDSPSPRSVSTAVAGGESVSTRAGTGNDLSDNAAVRQEGVESDNGATLASATDETRGKQEQEKIQTSEDYKEEDYKEEEQKEGLERVDASKEMQGRTNIIEIELLTFVDHLAVEMILHQLCYQI